MVRYKKIKASYALLGLLLAIAFIGCKSQYVHYINLYVDDSILTEKCIEQSSPIDTAFASYKIIPLEQLVIHDTTESAKITVADITDQVADSLIDHKKKQRTEIKDTTQLLTLRTERESEKTIDSIALADKQIVVYDTTEYPDYKVDTVDLVDNQIVVYDTTEHSDYKVDTVDLVDNLIVIYDTTEYPDYKADTIDLVDNHIVIFDSTENANQKRDTVVSVEDQIVSYDTIKCPDQKRDTVVLVEKQVIGHDSTYYAEQNKTIAEQQQIINSLLDKIDKILVTQEKPRSTDTIISITEVPVQVPVQVSLKATKENAILYRELLAKNETIEQLKSQLRSQQSVIYKKDTVTIIKEVVISDSTTSDTIPELFELQQVLNAQNDTIEKLKTQLNIQQLTDYKVDTIFITKEVAVPDPTPDTIPEFFALQRELAATNDTLQQLKGQLKKQQLIIQKRDTITFTAYFDSGKTRPKNETELLKQIKTAVQNKQVEKVTLSGHTDIKGSAEINKKLTQQRLEYIHSKIKTIIPIESIFLQNFADTFASKTMVPEERRVEIQIFIK